MIGNAVNAEESGRLSNIITNCLADENRCSYFFDSRKNFLKLILSLPIDCLFSKIERSFISSLYDSFSNSFRNREETSVSASFRGHKKATAP